MTKEKKKTQMTKEKKNTNDKREKEKNQVIIFFFLFYDVTAE